LHPFYIGLLTASLLLRKKNSYGLGGLVAIVAGAAPTFVFCDESVDSEIFMVVVVPFEESWLDAGALAGVGIVRVRGLPWSSVTSMGI
jgi:hypothetical protein